jgi:hypothetical protein
MSQPDPRQHDEATRDLYEAQAKAGRQVKIELERVHQHAGDRRDRYAGGWVMKNSEALGATTPDALSRFQAAAREAARLADEINDMDAIYATYRWSRYFLVTNTGGHVHRDRTCPTCFPATQYHWLPELSGCDEAAMITEFGEKACTVCFPDAPVNPAYHAPGRRDRAAIEARDAEKAGREAKKAAKNLTEGQQFRVDGSRVETVHGCIEVLRSEVEFRDYYGNGEHPFHADYARGAAEAARVLLAREAAAPGTGKTQAEISTIIERAIIRNRKDGARI